MVKKRKEKSVKTVKVLKKPKIKKLPKISLSPQQATKYSPRNSSLSATSNFSLSKSATASCGVLNPDLEIKESSKKSKLDDSKDKGNIDLELDETDLEKAIEKEEFVESIDEKKFSEFLSSASAKGSTPSLDQVALATPTPLRIQTGQTSTDEEDEAIKYNLTAGNPNEKYMSTVSTEMFYSQNDERINYTSPAPSLIPETMDFQRENLQRQPGVDPLKAMGIERQEDINMNVAEPGFFEIKRRRPGEKTEDKRYINN